MFLAAFPRPGMASIVIAFIMLLAFGLASIVVGFLVLIFVPKRPKQIASG